MRMTLCIAENRKDCEPGLRLLLASLAHHWPDQSMHVFYPDPDGAFLEWVANYPLVELNALPIDGDWDGYNIKPTLLAALIDQGYDAVTWIDADISFARSPEPRLMRTTLAEVIICEEAMIDTHGSFGETRTKQWGLDVGRSLPFAFNSCVLGVTREHRELLSAWQALLRSSEYRAAQRLDFSARPIHLMGDQEVLTALLASMRFAGIPIRVLRRGRDVIQYLGTVGYTMRERALHLVGGLPPIIHSQGYKPWWPSTEPKTHYDRILNLYKMLTPYRLIARQYQDDLVETQWLKPPTLLSRLIYLGAFGRPTLIGLPIAAAVDVVRFVRRANRHRDAPPDRFNHTNAS
ncbi:hypothetical protein [uncultured Sphingomonas sp.]|uniref:hypothetical protein n=1 Tax=uncultured Sphingomonas sp. TaxID=158754 RepID=UPI0035CB0BFA